MSPAVVLALAVLVATAVFGTLGRLIHQDLAQINEQLARSGHQPDMRLYMDQVRGEVHELHTDHVNAAEARFRAVETAVVDLRQKNADLGRYVAWMFPLVKQWARATERR